MSADPMLARLRPLPVRLRIAHLAALVRWERAANARERSPSYPSPRERERSLSNPSPLRGPRRASLAPGPTAARGEGLLTSDSRGRAG